MLLNIPYSLRSRCWNRIDLSVPLGVCRWLVSHMNYSTTIQWWHVQMTMLSEINTKLLAFRFDAMHFPSVWFQNKHSTNTIYLSCRMIGFWFRKTKWNQKNVRMSHRTVELYEVGTKPFAYMQAGWALWYGYLIVRTRMSMKTMFSLLHIQTVFDSNDFRYHLAKLNSVCFSPSAQLFYYMRNKTKLIYRLPGAQINNSIRWGFYYKWQLLYLYSNV